MLPVRAVHIQFDLQQLHDITAILFQEAELFPQDLAKLVGGDAVVDMTGEFVQDGRF
jgi:hypothetical protein